MSIPKTQSALRIERPGGPEVLQVVEGVSVPEVGADEVLVKVEYGGVNFIDTYFREGLYKARMPHILGHECAGTIVALGSNVVPPEWGYKVGDRVACLAGGGLAGGGGHAQYATVESHRVAKLPDKVSTKDGAALILQGLTALTCITDAHNVQRDEWILVHAAAGGLGLLFCQLCKARGAHVIGTVSTEEKAALAKRNGAEQVILYKDVPFNEVAERVKKLTPDGEGVHAVFDGVGADTFDSNFIALRRKGSLVSVGNASGTVPPFSILKLSEKNIKLVRPRMNIYTTTKEEVQTYCKEMFDLLAKGIIKVQIYKEYPFTAEGVRSAHIDLTSRASVGKLVIAIAPQ